MDLSLYESLETLDQDCKDYYESRGLRTYPVDARKSMYKGELSIWLPFCEIGTTAFKGVHKTYPSRVGDNRKVFSAGSQPEKGLYAYLGSNGNSDNLHIAEGVESLLSPMTAGIEGKYYACLNSNNLKKFHAWENGKLFIWADNDKSKTGQIAANKAARLNSKQRQCFILLPQNEGDDWNDVLLSQEKSLNQSF